MQFSLYLVAWLVTHGGLGACRILFSDSRTPEQMEADVWMWRI